MSNIVPGVFFGFRKAKRIVSKGMMRAPFIKENFEINLYFAFDSGLPSRRSLRKRMFLERFLATPSGYR